MTEERMILKRTPKEPRNQKLGNVSAVFLREASNLSASAGEWDRAAHLGTARRSRGGTPGAWRRRWTPLDWTREAPVRPKQKAKGALLLSSNRPAARAVPSYLNPLLPTSQPRCCRVRAGLCSRPAGQRAALEGSEATPECLLRPHWRELTRCSKGHSMPREHYPGTTGDLWASSTNQPSQSWEAMAIAPPSFYKNDRQHSSLWLSPLSLSLLPFLYWVSGTCVFLPIGWASELILFLFSPHPLGPFFKWIYSVRYCHPWMPAAGNVWCCFQRQFCRKCVLPSESIICRRKCVLANPMKVCIHRARLKMKIILC